MNLNLGRIYFCLSLRNRVNKQEHTCFNSFFSPVVICPSWRQTWCSPRDVTAEQKTSLSFKSEILPSDIRVTLRRASLSLLSFSLLCLGLCTVCVCRAAAWQRSNSCSHRGLVSSVWREKQRGVFDRVGSGDHSHNGGKKGILSHVTVSFKPP